MLPSLIGLLGDVPLTKESHSINKSLLLLRRYWRRWSRRRGGVSDEEAEAEAGEM